MHPAEGLKRFREAWDRIRIEQRGIEIEIDKRVRRDLNGLFAKKDLTQQCQHLKEEWNIRMAIETEEERGARVLEAIAYVNKQMLNSTSHLTFPTSAH